MSDENSDDEITSPYTHMNWFDIRSPTIKLKPLDASASSDAQQQLAVKSALIKLAAKARSGLPFPAGAKTAADGLLALRKVLDQQEATDLALAQSGKINFGYYTCEQEADDEGIETLTNLGIDPKAMLEDEANSLKHDGIPYPTIGDLDYQSCETLKQQNWIGPNGLYQFVPVGDLDDAHHTACYRQFNITREIEAHHLVPKVAPPPALPPEQWTAMLAALPTPPAPTAGSGGLSMIQQAAPTTDPAADPTADPDADAPSFVKCGYAIGTSANPLQM